MEKYTIEYKNSSKINLTKATKQKIASIEKELEMENSCKKEFDKESQIEIICFYRRFFRENTNFSYKNFERAVEEPDFTPQNKLFGTAITYRREELKHEMEFYYKIRVPLNREKTAMYTKVQRLANDFLHTAVRERYPEELKARCLVYLDDIIKEIDLNTKSAIRFCTSKISGCKAGLSNLRNFEDDERYNHQITGKEYRALKQADEEEKRQATEERKQQAETEKNY